ncbi:Serine--tRNA ligase, mitochondrial [Halotydeus destructor]|nr:Serine--tRNA ligase, mitochondrial [Halotydeus destructor]
MSKFLFKSYASWCRRRYQNDITRRFVFTLPENSEEKTSLTSSTNFDSEYLLNPANFSEILHSVKSRRLKDLAKVLEGAEDAEARRNVIHKNLSNMPNRLHHKWTNIDASIIPSDEIPPTETHGSKPCFNFEIKQAEKLLQSLKLILNTSDVKVGHIGGHRSYALLGDAARLEKELTNWTMKQLVNKFNFKPVIVPNLLYEDVVEGCGFNPKGARTQVYSIYGVNNASRKEKKSDDQINPICLAGTSEISLVGLHLGKRFDVDSEEKIEQLPKRYCAMSRCYRAETSSLKEESGLYRVHYFNKVEMVSLCRKEDSENTLMEFVEIQKYLFNQLGLHFRVLDMPPHELGLPARRKFDIEAYLPGRDFWGEISSASDCSDFQSRRFNITYRYISPDYESNEPFKTDFVSTVNATACATPRLLIPLIEANQDDRGRVRIPKVLQEAMGQEYLQKLYF